MAGLLSLARAAGRWLAPAPGHVWLVSRKPGGSSSKIKRELARLPACREAHGRAARSRPPGGWVYIDVHNHVIPDAVLRLGEQDSRLGISASDGMFRSPHHVPFPLLRGLPPPAGEDGRPG